MSLPTPPGAAKKISFIYFDAGGGHRAAAQALRKAIALSNRTWTLSLVNLQELLDEIDLSRKLTGRRIQDVYNAMLEKGWTLGAALLLRALQVPIRLYHRRAVDLLERHWRGAGADMVVSLVPNFNRAIAESVRGALPGAPFVTILTDLADYPPHFWIERESAYLVCGSERAAQQALEMGHPREKVFETSGMILHPAFYAPWEGDRAADRRSVGLEAERLTGLVMFGGRGAAAMLEIGRELSAFGNLQLIFICGRNPELQERLRQARFRIPVDIVGFTERVPHYMRMSDFFIGKPGPGSLSEALHMGLPVIVERNAWTLPQERFNTDWVREKELGIVLSSFRQVAGAVERLLKPGELERYRANVRAVRNRAVFEIPEILETILRQAQGCPEATHP